MIALSILVAALVLSILGNIWQAVRQRRVLADDPWSEADQKHITDSITKAQSMRAIALLFALAIIAPLSAADQPPQLDATKPQDALQIVEILTRDVTMTRTQAQALVQAIQTLAAVVEKSDAKPAPEPDAKPKE